MKPIKLKISVDINLNSKISDILSNKYGQQSMTPNLENYFSDFSKYRSAVSHFKEEEKTIKDLKTAIELTTKYINQLIAIKSRMIFGSQHQPCNIEFSWTDTLTNNNCTSSNINFEYYNVLFNLASLYFCSGYQKTISPNIDKALRKEAIKDFKYSLYLFNIIKAEVVNKISLAEMPSDLTPPYIDYCSTLCIIYGQIEIVKIAEETNPKEFNLRSKLLMGISENFNKAFNLSNEEPINSAGNDAFKNYLINRHYYYKSQAYKKLSEGSMNNFDTKGLGYGEALVYQMLSVMQLNECQNNINLCEGLIDINKFNEMFENEKKLEDSMLDLNKRIYHQYTPATDTLKLETKILMNALPIENLYIGENQIKIMDDANIYCEDLESLVPHDIKQMFDNYKIKINSFMEQYLTKYETDISIKRFIQSLNLPPKLTSKPIDVKNPNFWKKISEIQNLGGTVYLSNLMKQLLGKSNDLIEYLNTILSKITNEEKEDNFYRQKLGQQWTLTPSNTSNSNYIQTIKDYINQINKTREFDIKDNNLLAESIKKFEELNLPKEQLEEKIVQSQNKIQITSDEKRIREEIVKLYELGDKSYDITNPILKEIKSGSEALYLFSEVASNRMNEEQVFEETKQKYLKIMEPIEGISNQAKEQINKIRELCPNINENDYFPMENNNNNADESKYFANLENLIDEYMETIKKIKKFENIYKEIENNMSNLLKDINSWLDKRKNEQKTVLSSIRGEIPKYDPNIMENPFENNNNPNSDYQNSNNKNDYLNSNSNNLDNFIKEEKNNEFPDINEINDISEEKNHQNNNNNQNNNLNNYQNNNFNNNQNYNPINNQNYKNENNNQLNNQNYNQNYNNNYNPNYNQNNSQNYNQNNSQNYNQNSNINNNQNNTQNYNSNNNNIYQNNSQNYSKNFNSNLNDNQNKNQNYNSNYNQNSFGNNQGYNKNNNQNYNLNNNNYNQSPNQNFNSNQNNKQNLGFNQEYKNQNYNNNNQTYSQNQNYNNNIPAYNQSQNYNQNYNQIPNQYSDKNNNQWTNQNINTNYTQNQNFTQNSGIYDFGNNQNNSNNYNTQNSNNQNNEGLSGYSSKDFSNDNSSSIFYQNNNSNNNQSNNEYNMNNPPPGFQTSYSSEVHYNPNQEQNMNSFSSGTGNIFNQHSYSGQIYNNNTPYNNNQRY